MQFHLSKDLATKEVEPYNSHERYLVCQHHPSSAGGRRKI